MKPAAMKPAAMDPAAMDPAARDPAARDPAARVPAARVPEAPGPDQATLLRGCFNKEGARKLHREANRALRKPAGYARAKRLLEALVLCQGSKRWRKRRAAQQLAEVLAQEGDCAAVATAWKRFLDLLNAAQRKKPPRKPRCPAGP
jgi:hypothetical protein